MAPRSTAERVTHAKAMLREGGDAWVATAPAVGAPHLVILSAAWDEAAGDVVFCTEARSRTVEGVGEARVGLGSTRDVLLLHGTLTLAGSVDDDDATADLFTAATGWDPRGDAREWVFLRFHPTRALAWREADEIAGRTIMKDGDWLA